MVCIQNVRVDPRVVTRCLRKHERVETPNGSLSSIEWLQLERDRFARSGIASEIIETPTGRVALRKKN